MNLEGKILGARYEIIEKIGVGGMATVYKSRCHVLNRFVAVKILKDEFTTDEEFIKRFKVEAQSVASLTHPNIVSVYDVGNQENLYYIVMELVQGKTLKEIIVQDGALPWKWSANIAIQIASALEVAHKNKIIHRDIKPHNIIITEDGIAKVTDFGIAKAVSNSTITAFGATIGSVHYFSPEHARGGYTDEKSDIYSLGVVLYEMVTGKIPFDADTPVSVALKHMQEKPIEPIKLNPMLPQSINDIIMKAMEKDVTKRYQSSSDILKDLNMAVKNPEVTITAVSPSQSQDFATQKLPNIYDKPLEERIKEKDEMMDKEAEGRVKTKEKKGNFFKRHKKLTILLIILVAIALFVIPMLVMKSLMKSPLADVTLPDFVNMSLEEAKYRANELKLKVEVVEEQYSEEVLEGFVISQDPKYVEGVEFKIKENDTIKIWVSKGIEAPETVSVPKVKGETKDQAIKLLKDAGLEYEEFEESSDKVEKGIITKQDPAENTEVEKGSKVKIYVSVGKEPIKMPNLIGKKEQEAKDLISTSKLTVSDVVYDEDRNKADGTVLKQSISSGTSVEEGTGITITVNKWSTIKKGTANVHFKSFTGYTESTDPSNPSTPQSVELEVRVDGVTVYKKSHPENQEIVSVTTIEGYAKVDIAILINGVQLKTVPMDLTSTTVIDIKP